MHSFENVTSIKRKKSNWHVLLKFFKVANSLICAYVTVSSCCYQHLVYCLHSNNTSTHQTQCSLQRYSIPVSEQDTEDVMAAASGAIVKVLQTVYDYVHEDPSAEQAETVSMQSPGYDPNTAYSPEAAAAQQAMQQPMHDYPAPQYGMQQPLQALPEQHVQFYPEQLSQPYMQQPTAAYPSQAPPAQMQPVNSPYGHNIGRPIQGYPGEDPYAPYAAVQAPYPQAQPHSVQWQQPYGDMQPAAMQQPYAAGYMQSMTVAGAAPHNMQYGAEYAGQYQGAPARPPHTAASTSAPSIEYDRRPRPVDYKPYTQQDYASRNYDAKSQKEYWQLGTLGAQIDDEDLQVLLIQSFLCVHHPRACATAWCGFLLCVKASKFMHQDSCWQPQLTAHKQKQGKDARTEARCNMLKVCKCEPAWPSKHARSTLLLFFKAWHEWTAYVCSLISEELA